jgi:hypothetical protein
VPVPAPRQVQAWQAPWKVPAPPSAASLQAIAHGLAALGEDDHRKLALAFPMYDALFAWCRATAAGARL